MPDDERPRPAGSREKVVSREKTILGVARPIAASRERTILGIAPATAASRPKLLPREASQQEPSPEGWDLPEPAVRTREPSIAVDISELDQAAPDLAAAKPLDAEPSLVPAGLPHRRRGLFWLLALVVLAGAASYGYQRRETLQPFLRQLELRLSGIHMPAALRFWERR